jgi:hypothetical protein
LLIALAAGIAPQAAAAVPAAEVEALQMPAWLVRDGKRTPLAPGTRLRNGDELRTGAGARLLLRLADGSTVKLGEDARFTLVGVSMRSDGGLFQASLGVLQGAFRFTTTQLYQYRGRRDVQVHFTTVTAGIRGTDLWGKSTPERDIVALIEGNITVTRRGGAPRGMNEPKTVYQAPRQGSDEPVQSLSDELLARYAQETEIASGQGVAGKGGRWRVYAARTPNRDEALALYDRMRDAGYPAAIELVSADGATLYQVRIPGLLSEDDGVAMAIRLKSELGLQDVSVSLR